MGISLTATEAAKTRAEAPVSNVVIPQYRARGILAVWAAAALPMGILAWVVAPLVADHLSGEGNIPMVKALLALLTAGLAWQFVLVAILVHREQGTLRWSTVREALWLRSPRSPRSGRVGGRVWLIVIPLVVLFGAEELLPKIPGPPASHDFVTFLDSDAGTHFLSGNWGWLAVIVALGIFNTVLGEELLFRGFLLPRMNGAFGRVDWLVNGVLFAAYHLHEPWIFLAPLTDAAVIAYPTKYYRSAWIGIVVHSAQTVFLTVAVVALVLK